MNEPVYFVTGAAGFVGRHLCRHLRARGSAVRALVRRPEQCELDELGVELVRGDLNDPSTWRERLRGVDYVIHCAANAAFRHGTDYERTNVDGTRALLEAAAAGSPGLRRFVFVSTIGAIDRAPTDACTAPLDEQSAAHPQSEYGRSKLRAEKLVRSCGLPFAIVRPAMVVGADMRRDSHFAVFVRMAINGSIGARFGWPGEFSVVHVDDLASALELSATHPRAAGKTFFCAGAPVSLRACFELAAPGDSRVNLDWAANIATRFPRAVPFRLKAMLRPALTASDAALRELGWQPQYPGPAALAGVIARERARRDPDLDPAGQTVITGAASGLGAALTARLAPLRRQLLLVDRDRDGLARLQSQHPHCRIQIVDLADDAALVELTRSAAWRAFPVRELFACAGIGIRGPVLHATPAQHARLFQVNVLARLALAHAALPGMIRDQLGRIVFISSSSAFQPLPYMASYAASNAALLMLGEAWAAELAETGVHMMQVCPGGMSTNFQQSAGVKVVPGEKLMAPGEVAERILQGLAREKLTLVVSLRAHGMAWLARFLPRAASVALWRRLMARLR